MSETFSMVDEDNEFMDYEVEAEPTHNEFIVDDDDEYLDSEKSVVLGGSENLFMNCGLALLIVVLILVFIKMFRKKHHIKHSMVRNSQPACKKHTDTFNNVLVPSSYFDYNAHGTKYINWTKNS